MTTNTKPIETLRDGALKATIWKTLGEHGNFYRVRFTRTWKDDQGKFHDTDSFSGSEVLRVARLASLAYDRLSAFRSADRQTQAA